MSSSGGCTIPLELVDNFTAPTFLNTYAIRKTHDSPRFGHTNDMFLLLQGTRDEQKDYLKGLIMPVVAILLFFVIWLFILVAFRFLGPNEVGFLSGRFKRLPPEPKKTDPIEERTAWADKYNLAQLWLKGIQICVCISGFLIIISACLMSSKGVASLTKSLNDGTTAISLSESLANQAIRLIDQAVAQNERTGKAVDDLMIDLNGICPTLRPDGICSDVDDLDTCDFVGLFESPEIEMTLRHFKDGDQSVYFQELVNAKQNLMEFLDMTADLRKKADSFSVVFNVAMIFSLALTVLCLLINVGLLCRNSKLVLCLQHCLVVPAFTVLVLISFFFAMTFVMGSMTVADLCYDSPDGKILILLNRFRTELSPIVVEIASFYINACPADAVPQEITGQMEYLLSAGPNLDEFTSVITDTNSTFSQICGFDSAETIVSATDSAKLQVCQIVDFLDSLRRFFQCENWFPLYDETMYQAICYNGTDGFSWVATTQFVLVFFACVLLTLRAAFYDIEVERGDGTSKDGSPVNEDQYDEVMDFSEEDGGQEIRSTAYGKKDPGWNIRF